MGWLYELEEGKEVQWVEEVLPGLPAQNNVSATVQTCVGGLLESILSFF